MDRQTFETGFIRLTLSKSRPKNDIRRRMCYILSTVVCYDCIELHCCDSHVHCSKSTGSDML